MKRRIFIAVNLPDKVKEKLSEYQSQWSEIPANWTKKENLHITLSFLGYLADEDLPDVLVVTEKVAAKAESFSVVLDKICYGPKGKNPPRMIWATGESEELSNLQRELEKSLIFSTEDGETKSNQSKKHTIHVTLARIRQWDFRKIDPEESPIIDNEIALSFSVNSIDIMESVLKKGGPQYIILESYSLEH